MMTLSHVVRVGLCCLLLLVAAFGAPKAKMVADVIFDKADFISRLPKVVLVMPRNDSLEADAASTAAFEKALASLGEMAGKKFHTMPKDSKIAKVVRTVKPTYPPGLRSSGTSGDARFLVLISAAGKVIGVYCHNASHEQFAVAGGESIAQWTFEPARIGETKVPILANFPIYFTISSD